MKGTVVKRTGTNPLSYRSNATKGYIHRVLKPEENNKNCKGKRRLEKV